MVDPIARAYATIGLPRGASARELKKQYRRLVRQWHPDRWTNDPTGQAEAADRMRAINDAYATLEDLLPKERPAPRKASRPLTKEEMDAIVRAIGTESYAGGVIKVLLWMLPMVAAFLMLQPKRGLSYGLAPPSAGEVFLALLLFAIGLGGLYSQRKRRS